MLCGATGPCPLRRAPPPQSLFDPLSPGVAGGSAARPKSRQMRPKLQILTAASLGVGLGIVLPRQARDLAALQAAGPTGSTRTLSAVMAAAPPRLDVPAAVAERVEAAATPGPRGHAYRGAGALSG